MIYDQEKGIGIQKQGLGFFCQITELSSLPQPAVKNNLRLLNKPLGFHRANRVTKNMPRTESVVTVFISCPSDDSAEREILDTVINELNKTWSRTLGIRFEPIMWETHSRPAFGNDP